MEALTSSNRGAENDSDMVPEKSSMGLISSRIQPVRFARAGRPLTDLPTPVTDQPVERLGLNGKEVGHLKVFGDPSE
jgi:hypothetical protein